MCMRGATGFADMQSRNDCTFLDFEMHPCNAESDTTWQLGTAGTLVDTSKLMDTDQYKWSSCCTRWEGGGNGGGGGGVRDACEAHLHCSMARICH